MRRRARESGIPGAQGGAVTAIQRFGSALNLTPHFHALVFDGVYAAGDGEPPRFYSLRPPDGVEVEAGARRVAERVAALPDLVEEEGDEPAMAPLYSASVIGRIADGPNAGRRVMTAGLALRVDEEERFKPAQRSAIVEGFSIHAGVSVRAGDRRGLEHLCRYISRPALAADRLEVLADGRLSYRLKTPWRNGCHACHARTAGVSEKTGGARAGAACQSHALSRRARAGCEMAFSGRSR